MSVSLPIFESVVADGFAPGFVFSESIVSDVPPRVSLVKSGGSSVRPGVGMRRGGNGYVPTARRLMVRDLENNHLTVLQRVFRIAAGR